MVETPDPFINAAAAALNVGADGVWDEQQSAFMHGSIAWRTKLLGWRGPYLGDALGWHDRNAKASRILGNTAKYETDSRSARQTRCYIEFCTQRTRIAFKWRYFKFALRYESGYIDALFRHLLWTGDVEFAEKCFPLSNVILLGNSDFFDANTERKDCRFTKRM